MSEPEATAERDSTRSLDRRRARSVSREDAASRVAAFVYGNILVMAALVALHPDDLLGAKAMAYVAGTGVSTLLAHVLADAVGSRVRTGERPTAGQLRHELRDAVPIVSSVTVPLLILGAARWGWLDPELALQAAILVTVARLTALGWVVERIGGRRPTVGTFVSGALLGGLCLGVAVVKWWLTH